MPPTEADRQAVARLTAEPCKLCRGSKHSQPRPVAYGVDHRAKHYPCPDCLLDGKPTGRRWPGLVRECDCIPDKDHPEYNPEIGRVFSWHYNSQPRPRSKCRRCSGTGTVPVEPEAALGYLVGETLRRYEIHFIPMGEHILCRLVSHQPHLWPSAKDEGPTPLSALAAALAWAKEEGSATT